jgi:hypothetical protein
MAVLFVLAIVALLGWPSSVYLFHKARLLPLTPAQRFEMYGCFLAATVVSVATWRLGMRTGLRALAALE